MLQQAPVGQRQRGRQPPLHVQHYPPEIGGRNEIVAAVITGATNATSDSLNRLAKLEGLRLWVALIPGHGCPDLVQ